MPRGNTSEPLVTVVGFHHARGPEIETWFGAEDGVDPATENDWSLLPFMALSDGAHASTEDFSYFTLRHESTISSLFGISCTRQIDANLLLNKPDDVTRSTVQKAVVVITNEPQHFGQLRERLSAVTGAWFAQRDFTDVEILKSFQESLAAIPQDAKVDQDQYLGLSLREMIHEFKYQTLVLFKCLLLQPKMLFFGSRCERLCMIQFSLISLIPGLLRSLQDCADPSYDNHEKSLVMPTSLKTSERSSLLAYMGLPLQIFGKGAFFGPYTPLQQLDLLADYGTKSYIVGSTNSLLLQQKDRYSDILINLDDSTINITSTSLRQALSLSPADRRWIDFLTQSVQDTWDDANPSHPKNHTYIGSEEFIRLQFEEYLLALLSSAKYQTHLFENPLPPSSTLTAPNNLADISRQSSRSPPPLTLTTSSPDPQEPPGDPAPDFQPDFLAAWRLTRNFATYSRLTTPHLFDIVIPRHPCAGGLTIEDVQRRITQQVAELHLDERVREGREVLNKHLATGQKKLNSAFANLWADLESMREAQRKKRSESSEKDATKTVGSPIGDDTDKDGLASPPLSPTSSISSQNQQPTSSAWGSWSQQARARAPELSSQAQATAQAAGQRASAYLNSWSSWASDKKKDWEARRAAGAGAGNTTSVPPVSRDGSGVSVGAAVGGIGVTPETDRTKRDSGFLGRWSSSFTGRRSEGEDEKMSAEEREKLERGRERVADVGRE